MTTQSPQTPQERAQPVKLPRDVYNHVRANIRPLTGTPYPKMETFGQTLRRLLGLEEEG